MCFAIDWFGVFAIISLGLYNVDLSDIYFKASIWNLNGLKISLMGEFWLYVSIIVTCICIFCMGFAIYCVLMYDVYKRKERRLELGLSGLYCFYSKQIILCFLFLLFFFGL